MGATGDDLKQYLILPSSSTSPYSSPAASTAASGTQTAGYYHKPAHHSKAENTNMEVETPTQQAMFAYAHDKKSMSYGMPIEGVMKIDDYLNMHQADHDAQIPTRATPASKKAKTNNETAVPLTPVAVGARSSKHTILLHEKYQALGIPQPLFTYGGGGDSGWTVSVSFPGLEVEELQDLNEEGRFNSKQEAKEASSKTTLAILEELVKEGKVKKAEKVKAKKKKSATGASQQQVQEEKEPGENYVGQLLEFQRSIGAAQPTYVDYQSGNRFACLLTIEGHDTQFGSLDTLLSSKKAARQEAARHAVSHFKAQGVWPETATAVGGIKKKKAQPTRPEIVSTSSSSGRTASLTPVTTNTPASMSYAQQVATLAHILSLPTPEWKYTPHPSDKDFHSVSCSFRGAGAHEGPIGEVRNVFGKKKAKEECAKLTLEYLEEVRERRVDYGRRMMQGVGNAEDVVGVAAAGRAVDDEADALAARQTWREDSEDLFESADEF